MTDPAIWWRRRRGAALPAVPLEDLAKIRGAMWTARLDVPWGPRPNQIDNCICLDYFECFSPSDQDRIIAAYGPKGRGYTHAPMGPFIDPGYHGQLPATDWRNDPAVYLDAAGKLEAAGIHAVHFLRPDRGVVGHEWTVADLDRELGSIFASPHAQEVMRIVCLGWEPGPKYFYDNAWWVEMLQWQARTFPNALRLIHMVADTDAPTGRDDDKHLAGGNAEAWRRCVPYLHGWLVQVAGYVDGTTPIPSPRFLADFTALFADLQRRFQHGHAGWPTTSAWPDGPLKVYAGEYAAFGDYWKNWPERESVRIGDLAMRAGSDGFLDGGTV